MKVYNLLESIILLQYFRDPKWCKISSIHCMFTSDWLITLSFGFPGAGSQALLSDALLEEICSLL